MDVYLEFFGGGQFGILGHDKIWEWQEGSDTLYIGSVKKTFKFILSVTKSPVFQRAKQASPFKRAF